MAGGIFSFGRFRLLARERVLMQDGAPVLLGSRAFDLLVVLLEHAGETVNHTQLFEEVWPDILVSKVNLRVAVAAVRKALEDGRNGNRFIINVSGRGYRFVAPVSRALPAMPAEATIESLKSAAAVCFVDFSGIDDSARVAMAVASALGCEAKPQQSLTSVLAYLRNKKMLLVFENCGHVVAGVSQITERLLTDAPMVHVLVAGQEALRLSTRTEPGP